MHTQSTQFNLVRDFAPGWFASVMGTAVIAVAFFSFRDVIPFAEMWMLLFLGLGILMFSVMLIPWTLRWFLHFDAVWRDLNHPVSAAFFPTMPISLLVIGIALEKAGPLFLTHSILLPLLEALWFLGASGIAIFAVVILNTFFLQPGVKWEMANLGWLIPPVSALLVPVLGSPLATEYAGTDLGTINLLGSLVFLGFGGMLFVFVMTAVFARYIFHDLPPVHLAPTIWIGLAPSSILAIVMIKIVKPATLFFNANDSLNTLNVIGKFIGISLWGFALFWLVLVIAVTTFHHRKTPLPFALSWWAFVFPLGAFVVATGAIYAAVPVAFFQWTGLAALSGLLVLWATVGVRTVGGIASGTIFKSHVSTPQPVPTK